MGGTFHTYFKACACMCVYSYGHIHRAMCTHMSIHVHMKKPSCSTHISTTCAVIAWVSYGTSSHPGRKDSFLGAERAARNPEAEWQQEERRRGGGRGQHFPGRRSDTCGGWQGRKRAGFKEVVQMD